jgi:hypothetical protein
VNRPDDDDTAVDTLAEAIARGDITPAIYRPGGPDPYVFGRHGLDGQKGTW